jgi:S-adenosylmethionine/arginine decarboxylase-like enzyme
MESLGYGTQLILDGFNAEAKGLQDKAVLEACLREVAALLEPVQSDILHLREPTGSSANLRLGESHLSLHAFSDTLSLQIFSRHDVPLSAVTELLGKHFSVRRVESFLSNHAKTLPQESEARKKVLLGDRAYSALRLEAALV